MTVLVAYATRHGATAGIAERIASTLTDSGVAAEARPVDAVDDVTPYDAVVLGAAAYMYHWLKPATAFAKRHRSQLTARPVWLFSSGPIGTDTVDAKGADVFVTSRPKEFDELAAALHARGERVFFGAFDPTLPPIGLAERTTKHLPASARDAMPAGDFRDWPAIDAWAQEIASSLRATG